MQNKDVHAVQLTLLKELIRVLEKHNIRYFASGGTLLGAVRHSGYIPWDDDIDIMMLREDYERLLKLAESEFSSPLFFQSFFSDKGYFRGHAQLRRSDTTGALKEELYSVPFNQGIFIDIFPLDSIPDSPLSFKIQLLKIKCLNFLLNHTVRSDSSFKKRGLFLFKNALARFVCIFLKPERVWVLLNNVCKKYSGKKTARVAPLLFDSGCQRYRWKRVLFDDCVYLKFEDLELCCPCGYDEILSQQYGDYKTPRREPTLHGDVIFDTNTPYLDYIKQHKNQNNKE